jgi:polysaccharide export outer membrane protein
MFVEAVMNIQVSSGKPLSNPFDRKMKSAKPRRLWGKKRRKIVAANAALAFMLAIMFCLIPASGKAQDRQQQSNGGREEGGKKNSSSANTAASNVWVVSQDDYYIGPSDVLEIKIEDAPELSQSYTVSVAGFIEIQVVGKLQAINKTPDQLAASLREALIKADYLKRPRVSVNVTEYNSRTFFIHGSVRNAGAYKIRGKVTILDLIVVAGGMSETHGPNAYIIRRKKQAGMAEGSGNLLTAATSQTSSAATTAQASTPPNATPNAADLISDNQEYELITANINGLERGRFNQNLTLQPGDVVNIPSLNVFFIGGEVHAPGSFPLKEGTTLRQALTLAQGTTFKAAKSRAVIFRGNKEDGKQVEIPIDIDAVMSGKKEDILLQADDLVVVPSSRMKSIGGTVLQAFGMATVQRGLIR